LRQGLGNSERGVWSVEGRRWGLSTAAPWLVSVGRRCPGVGAGLVRAGRKISGRAEILPQCFCLWGAWESRPCAGRLTA